MQTTRALRAAATAASLIVLAGCSPQPVATPTPTADGPRSSPTYTCTPAGGGDPYPCTGQQYTDQQRQQVLVDQAESVYKKYFNEASRLYRVGGASQATSALTATTADAYLAAKQNEFASLKAKGLKAVGGNIKLAKMTPNPDATDKGADVGLDTCIDATTVQLKSGDQVVSNSGFAVAGTVYLKRQGNDLKIVDAEERQVANC